MLLRSSPNCLPHDFDVRHASSSEIAVVRGDMRSEDGVCTWLLRQYSGCFSRFERSAIDAWVHEGKAANSRRGDD